MLLTKKEPISFEYVEDEANQHIEDADWTLYNELINGLVITTNIIQNLSYNFWKRIYVVIELVSIIQNHIEDKKLDALRKRVEHYKYDEYLINAMGTLDEGDIAGFEKGVFIQALFKKVLLIAREGGLNVA